MAEVTDPVGIRPAVVEIMSAEEVAAITQRYDALIRSLEAELVVALDEADRADARLRDHPAAQVIDDDFEAFVRWATESQVTDIRRDNDRNIIQLDSPSALAGTPISTPVSTPISTPISTPVSAPVDPRIDVQARVEASLRTAVPEAPTLLATPVVAPPPPPAPAAPIPAPTDARNGRSTGRTTVVTRPGATPPPPPPAPPAAPAPQTQAQPVQPVQPPSAPPAAEPFWDDGRTPRASRATRTSRPSRAERDARGHLSTLPSTLLLQAGAVIAIVAILVLKLG